MVNLHARFISAINCRVFSGDLITDIRRRLFEAEGTIRELEKIIRR